MVIVNLNMLIKQRKNVFLWLHKKLGNVALTTNIEHIKGYQSDHIILHTVSYVMLVLFRNFYMILM